MNTSQHKDGVDIKCIYLSSHDILPRELACCAAGKNKPRVTMFGLPSKTFIIIIINIIIKTSWMEKREWASRLDRSLMGDASKRDRCFHNWGIPGAEPNATPKRLRILLNCSSMQVEHNCQTSHLHLLALLLTLKPAFSI